MAKKIQIDELENMEKERTKAVEQCFNPAREKYIRQVDGPKIYPMGRHSFDKLARQSGAIVRYCGMVLVDTTIINKFLDDNFREPAELI